MAESAEGLTFILPVHDGEKLLARTIAGWLPTLNSLNRPYELLIVDDGSLDGTKAQAEALAEKNNRLHVLGHPERAGFGACLRTALAAAQHSLVFYTSIDHGWNHADLPKLLKSLDLKDEYTGKQVEVVNGHRRGTAWPAGRRRVNALYRLFMRAAFGFWPDPLKGYLGSTERRFWWRCRVLFGLRLGDVNSKFKLFRRRVFERFEIQSDGEFVHAELLAKANFLGCMMDEVVLNDRDAPPPAPDVRKEMWRVFNQPKFRTPPVAPPAPSAPAPPSAEAAPTATIAK